MSWLTFALYAQFPTCTSTTENLRCTLKLMLKFDFLSYVINEKNTNSKVYHFAEVSSGGGPGRQVVGGGVHSQDDIFVNCRTFQEVI